MSKRLKSMLGPTVAKWFIDNEEFVGKYLVVCLVALAQGVLALSEVPINFLYKDNYGMSPAEVSFIVGIIALPWVFKPIYGIMSDSIPICGERRKSYIMIFSFLAFVNWMLLAFYVREKAVGLVILFNIQFCTAFCNVVGEAMLVEISQLKSKKFNMNDQEQQAEASQNVSLFFGVKSFGTLATAYLGGFLLEVMDKYYIFAITGIFPFLLFISTFYMVDQQSSEELTESEQNRNLSQIQLFFRFLKKPQIYQPLIFIFLFAATPTSSSSMFFFYTNQLGFEPQFMGSLKFIHAAGTLLAIFIYNKYLKTVEFSLQFIVSTLFCVVLGLSQILLVTRLNVQLGIPDKIFCLGDSIIIQIVGELNILPLLVLACRLCPRTIEATMYAMIMSTLNLGSLVSSQLGGVLIYLLGITEDNFDNLWILILIANLSTAVPLIGISLIDQKGKKLTDSDLSSKSNSEIPDNISSSDKEEVKSERSSLVDHDSNTSTDYKNYGAIEQNEPFQHQEMLNIQEQQKQANNTHI
ncbi:hypothetical protein ABPG74_000180 [Tetrahymena malaccensis]